MSPEEKSARLVSRKISFPTVRTVNHDFRKEYKGSVLESKFQKQERKESRWTASLKALADLLSLRRRILEEEEEGPFETVPNEILCRILGEVDEKSALSCRRVCRRWNAVGDYVSQKTQKPGDMVISRLIVSSTRKGVELRRVSYTSQKAVSIVVPWSQVKAQTDLGFSFRRFQIQRIIIKETALTDCLVDFLRVQLAHSDLSTLCQFSLHKVDFSEANSLTLHRILAPLAKKIEFLEVTQCYGMRADSITDSHLSQLDSARLRRVHIDGVRFSALRRAPALRIGDVTLKQFAEAENFPVLVLDRCSVTTEAVCQYTKLWLDHLAEDESGLCTPVCTVKRCIYVNCTEFEEACRRQGLLFRHRRGSGTMTLYNLQSRRIGFRHSLSLSISPPEQEKEDKEKQ